METQRYFNPEIETASREQLNTLQLERLKETVTRVYNQIPFYQKKFDEIGLKPEDIKSLEDIRKLPFTEKQDLRDNYPYGLVAVPKEDLMRIHASSGTTGKQTVVAYTRRDIDAWAEDAARALVMVGATKSDFIHVSYGYGLFTGGFGLHYGAEKLGATVIPVSSGNTQRQIQIMRDFGSNVLCCTPSYAMYLGEALHEMGLDPKKDISLRAGIFGAEPWSEEMRKEIEARLNIKAYDIYGLSEIMGPGVAMECEEQTGMHVNEDKYIIEIINPDTGEPCQDGEIGEVIFTCIYKEALPLIRYRTRDLTSISHAKCSCGRNFVKMMKPRGRTDDMLIIRGVNVFPTQIETVLLEMGMQPEYQLVVNRVNNLDTLEVQVEMSENLFSDEVKKIEQTARKIRGQLQTVLGLSADVTMVSPHSIARSEGKAKRVIDHRKI